MLALLGLFVKFLWYYEDSIANIKDKNASVRCDYIKSVSNCRDGCGERTREK